MKRRRSRKAPVPELILKLELSPTMFDMIEELLLVGLFGHSREDIIERLLCHRLRELEREGWCGTNNTNARLGR